MCFCTVDFELLYCTRRVPVLPEFPVCVESNDYSKLDYVLHVTYLAVKRAEYLVPCVSAVLALAVIVLLH